MKDLIAELRKRLIEAVPQKPGAGLLFSGGLDSSVLAAINPGLKAITVSLESYGEDIDYSDKAAGFLKAERVHRSVSIKEASDAIPGVIRILKSFDPAIPNDLAVYFGLKQAKDLGLKEVITGDGSDELFAGYLFMRDITDLPGYINKISQKMYFSSNAIAEFFGISLIQPFMEKNLVEFALTIPVDLKIKGRKGEIHGKWILRKAFEDILPERIIWQEKRPLEHGSGMTEIRKTISDRVRDDEFEEARKKSSIKFMNKEHFYYYRIYRSVVVEIPEPKGAEIACPGCGAGLQPSGFHCRVCGYVKAA